MKKLLLYCILSASSCGLYAQSTTATNIGGAGRYLGYSNNVIPLLFNTNAQPRMKLNNSLSYTVNGYNTNRDGYLLIGFPGNSMQTGLPIYTSTGAYSMLHLNGRSVDVQEYGHKSWMQTGITFTDNKDLSYVGLRKLGAIEDFTEMVIAWSDNGPGIEGPDRMVFRFSGWGGSDGTVMSSNLLSNTDLDGLHIAEFMPSGLMGLGNSFGTNSSIGTDYVDPQSLFHQSYTHQAGKDEYGFMQMTYRPGLSGGGRGFGETENDGLRLGIDNVFVNGGLNAYLRWQEGTPFVVQTDWDDIAGDVWRGERWRASATGMPGVPNAPSGAPNLTRISIPYNGATPVAAPKATLQIGYDSPLPASYANWMEYGTLVANANSTLFTGLTNQTAADPWQSVIGFGGSNLLFANASGGEMARIQQATGNMGIGNFGTAGLATAPSEKIDVNGNARFRNIPAAGGQSIILGLQPGMNVNDVKLSRLAFPADPDLYLAGDGTWQPIPVVPPVILGGAHNGVSNSTLDPTKLAFGQNYNQAGAPAQLLSTRELPMNNNNIIFTNPASPNNNSNRIGIGTISPQAKLDVTLKAGGSVIPTPTAFTVVNEQTGGVSAFGEIIRVTGTNNSQTGSIVSVNAATGSATGVAGNVYGTSATSGVNIGVSGVAAVYKAQANLGIQGVGRVAKTCVGGRFEANNNITTTTAGFNRGVWSGASGTGDNITAGVISEVNGSGRYNYGVESRVYSTSGLKYGVYSIASSVGNAANRAGYFVGDLQYSGTLYEPSDSMFKTNISPVVNALDILSNIEAKTFFMDTVSFERMNFSSKKQYGYIAQELEVVLPELVSSSHHPAEYDSLGVETAAAIDYKAVNYNALIPITSQAVVDLNKKVDAATLSDETIKTNVQDLSGSLDKVLAMRGVSYDWNQTVHPELNLDSSNHVGFIAQEIQQIDNRLTFTADDNLLHVEYDKVVPILAEAIQELNGQVESKDSIINVLVNENADQQETIDDLNDRLSQLENCLSGILPYLCQLSHSAIQANTPAAQEEVRKNVNITLSNHSTIILDQNVPNPFAEQTVINFSIPETVQKAQIHFYDGMGKLIQSVDVVERGLGSITVFGSDLSTGVYTYTLVADGQAVATKKMMKQ